MIDCQLLARFATGSRKEMLDREVRGCRTQNGYKTILWIMRMFYRYDNDKDDYLQGLPNVVPHYSE